MSISKRIHVDWCRCLWSFMWIRTNGWTVPAEWSGKYWHEDDSPQVVGQYTVCSSCILAAHAGSMWIDCVHLCIWAIIIICCFCCIKIINTWENFSLTLWQHRAGGGGVFLLCLVHSGPVRLPYLPDQLQSNHQWRCEYPHIVYQRL